MFDTRTHNNKRRWSYGWFGRSTWRTATIACKIIALVSKDGKMFYEVLPDEMRRVQRTYNQRKSTNIMTQLQAMVVEATSFVNDFVVNEDISEDTMDCGAPQPTDLPTESPADPAVIDDEIIAPSVHAPDLLAGEDSDLEEFGPSDSGSEDSESESGDESMQGPIQVPKVPGHKWRPNINVGSKQCIVCKKKKKSTPATHGPAEKKAGGTVADVQYCARCAKDSDIDCAGDRNERLPQVDCFLLDCCLAN
jgi:hypothetical protein